MRVDIGNALASEADPGISRADLDDLDERVADAHDRIASGMADDEFGYAALTLPERTDTDGIEGAVEGFDPEAILTVGIGGSALGAITLTDALAGDSPIDHYALDNVDPAYVNRLLDDLPLGETVVHVVSRSGTTAETLANFLVVRDAMNDAGVDWTDRTVVTTGESGPLRDLAESEGLPALDVPAGVPGRFSALSTVGLVPAAIVGVDLDGLLAGGQAGATALSDSLYDCPAYAYGAVAYALDNVDPAHVDRLLDDLPLAETVVHVVSRSGTTAETLANFLVVREAFEREGVDWTERTIVTTGESGPLRRLADRHDLPTLPQPEGVPGRFSAFSTVGLAAAAVRGHDLDELVAGAASQRETLSPSLFSCPAYAYGAVAYALDARGASVNAMMPYAESLETYAEWFAQLWAESLGKDGLGQTPARALGATDQHSQLQLYRAGPRDKLVTMVRARERADRRIPEPDVADLAYLRGHGLGDLLDAEFEATEASLAAAGRPTVRIELDRLDARSVGRLLYDVEAACVLFGELAEVETFTQPAVEWGKRATRGLLGGGDVPEAAAVSENTRLVVE